MQVRTKKGERYTGGRYHFTLELTSGSFDLRHLESGLNSIVSRVAEQYYISRGGKSDKNSLYLCRAAGMTDLFGHTDENIVRISFSREKRSRIIEVRAKIRQKSKRTINDYAEIDNLMRAMFGTFERINDYGSLEASTQSEAQLFHRE